jgi:hypothetical protein
MTLHHDRLLLIHAGEVSDVFGIKRPDASRNAELIYTCGLEHSRWREEFVTHCLRTTGSTKPALGRVFHTPMATNFSTRYRTATGAQIARLPI